MISSILSLPSILTIFSLSSPPSLLTYKCSYQHSQIPQQFSFCHIILANCQPQIKSIIAFPITRERYIYIFLNIYAYMYIHTTDWFINLFHQTSTISGKILCLPKICSLATYNTVFSQNIK